MSNSSRKYYVRVEFRNLEGRSVRTKRKGLKGLTVDDEWILFTQFIQRQSRCSEDERSHIEFASSSNSKQHNVNIDNKNDFEGICVCCTAALFFFEI